MMNSDNTCSLPSELDITREVTNILQKLRATSIYAHEKIYTFNKTISSTLDRLNWILNV